MSTQPQYANTARIGVGQVSTGDTSRTAPTNFANVITAGQNGSRIDRINLQAIGTTIASMVRLFLLPGAIGMTLASLTFSGTTATATTTTPHGLVNGQTINIRGCFPSPYNADNVAVTVTSATSFTYPMTSTPTSSALVMGYYIAFPTVPVWNLWTEIPVSAITPSSTVAAFSSSLSSAQQTAQMPLYLPAGWALRASVNDAQTASGINVIAFAGDF
ncbi:hypothetical protein PQR01_00410 [Paraburkholderia rhynchosiae]|uniref:Uncharacterized protein n=1 Tax=Paraburkholderia rhynchosiae TaxID=487049 RepID=A0ACC7N8C8_9BURK